ncbi:MAG: hypothetical protein ACR2RE_26895 [Geminicoccaceae bacterium]
MMDSTGGVTGNVPSEAANGQQAAEAGSEQAGPSAEDQAAFNKAVEEAAAGELLTDYFVVEQPMIDEINKQSSK